MQEILRNILKQRRELAKQMEDRFEQYFREAVVPDFGHASPETGILAQEILTPGDREEAVHERIRALPGRPGLYVLMTDYLDGADCCTFLADRGPLRAIYRGHSSNVMERVMGHLTNERYLAMCKSRTNKKPWGSYLRISDGLTGDGGIDITRAPYASSRWAVVVYEMTPSSRDVRECAENGFAAAFGLPARSRNEPNNPVSRTARHAA